MEDFHATLLNEVKKTYSTENIFLKNLSSFDTFISLGYPEDFLKIVPEEILKYAFPIAYPFNNIKLFKKVVVDLGSGAGLDSIIAAKLESEKVFSVDLSISFLKNLKKFNFKNIFPLNANIEKRLLKKNSADIVLMNGSFNIVFNKNSLLENIYDILKNNGLLIICDLMWGGSLNEREFHKNDINSWCWCSGGCLTERELLSLIENFSFSLKYKRIFEKIDILERAKYIFVK